MTDEDADLLRSVSQFRADASTFCALIGRMRRPDSTVPYCELMGVLSALAVSGFALPWADSEAPNDALPDPPEAWSGLSRELDRATAEAVGELIESEKCIDQSTLGIMLFDDLADLYADLSLGLQLIDRGSEGDVAKAVWNWRFRYETHWGQHLISAMQAVHSICFRLHRA